MSFWYSDKNFLDFAAAACAKLLVGTPGLTKSLGIFVISRKPARWILMSISFFGYNDMGRYDIKQVAPDRFDLYEDGVFLCSWSRSTFRGSISVVAYSSNWVGSILRLFNKSSLCPLDLIFKLLLNGLSQCMASLF